MTKLKSFVFILTGIAVSLMFYVIVSSFDFPIPYQQNSVPIVKIISPANNSSFAAKQLVHYSISVSDKEDGESKYDEINPKEVLLEIKYLQELPTSVEKVGNDGQKDPPGLAAIRTSNCFNCHGFNTKTMGPTFTQISQRYPQTTSNIALLAKRIREGSKGIWGNESMPTHPEMTDQQLQNIVKWIMQIASDNSVDYYTGTEGSFALKEMNGKIKNQACVLKATYTDHGIDNAGIRLTGQDVIVLRIK